MPIELRGLAYLGLRVPDVDAWYDFATRVVGMMPARRVPGDDPMTPTSAGTGRTADGAAFFKVDERVWRVAVDAGEPGIAYVGFEVGDEAAFEAAVAHLVREGVEVRRGTAEEVAHRFVRDLAWCTDPSGVRVEICWGPTGDGGFRSPVGGPGFVTGHLGLGHYVLLVADLQAGLDFYQRALGLRLSDYVVLGPGMSVQFLRCNPRHHTVALTAVGPFDGVHHIAFELPDVDQVGLALDRAVAAGMEITASLGRHKNDRMLSFYMRSPAGFEVELGCGALRVDDATWVVNHFTGGDEWGHHGLTGESLAAAAEGAAE